MSARTSPPIRPITFAPVDDASACPDVTSPLAETLANAGMPIVHIDRDLILIDKPAGLLSVETEAEKADTAFAVLLECLAAH